MYRILEKPINNWQKNGIRTKMTTRLRRINLWKSTKLMRMITISLSTERRKHYDNTGVTENEAKFRNRRDYSQYRKFDPLDDLFGPNFGGFKFHYQDRDVTLFHKLSVTTRGYENKLVPKSQRLPYLIMFYSDWCFACSQVEPVWRRILEELEPLGMGLATIHAENEQLLTRKIGVSTLPSLVMLIDGKPSIYKETIFSVQKIIEFVRSKFPYKLVQPISDENLDTFLDGWVDNRVRALIFEQREAVRLRYLLMAFYYRDRVAFGFVQLNSVAALRTQQRFKVPLDIETLLLFNENIKRPVASLSMSDMPIKTMQDIINSNKYLLLPRLSSQNTPFHDEPRQALRQFAQESPYSADRVRFTYIFQERQAEFISALTSGEGSPPEPTLHVVIIWRRDSSHIKYEWLSHMWDTPETHEWNETREHLESTIQRLLHDSEALSYEAVVKVGCLPCRSKESNRYRYAHWHGGDDSELIDEHAQGIVSRILTKLLVTADFLKDNVTRDQLLPVISVLATIIFIIVGGYVMTYLVRLEEENIQKQYKNGHATFEEPSTNAQSPCYRMFKSNSSSQLRLHECRAETYNGMVRLLKPGCRTIILLVDADSRNKLIPNFHRSRSLFVNLFLSLLRRNKTLMFGHMSLERGLDWYKTLLTMSLPEPRDLKINPRNCIGTVLSLNGHRKYFCMYHAKHPECIKTKGSKVVFSMFGPCRNTVV
uniref:Thioredoxin domain-containing protein n=1 Tax=Timema bartmani TaxID=61472 RepID=A0A7R9EZV0_9NEOP|nr:unnamed protein product [Timema bartmani]